VRVLVIPEDFRKDQYILQPLVAAMLAELGRPRARIQVCRDPLLGGIGEALKAERINEIIERYKGMVDLFLLCVDRDGNEHRRQRLDALETIVGQILPAPRILFAEHAWQELEVWVLAGHDLLDGWSWPVIRAEPNPKELYFDRLAQERGLINEPGGGRRTLGQEAARRYNRICQRCPEDIGILEARIRAWIGAQR
jgi:hypothetical protein